MEDFAKTSLDIIKECKNTILNQLFESLGQNNIVSVILTGSIGRGQAVYNYVDGRLYLESDLDVVVVVNRKSLIKTLTKIKYLAIKLTQELKQKRLLSGVSLAAMTENSLYNSGPSIFYQDLKLHGKTIFGKELIENLISYDVRKIPVLDIYRLLFNRMVETLQVFVSSRLVEKKIGRDNFISVLNGIEKLTFALVQALLIKNNVLIFRGFNLQEIKIDKLQQNDTELMKQLLESYKELKKMESGNSFSEDVFEHCWNRGIKQFNLTLKKIANTNVVTDDLIRKLVVRKEKFSRRIRLLLIIFLQYFRISHPVDLFRTMNCVLRFGSDYPYLPLYGLFLSTTFPMVTMSKTTEISHMMGSNKQNLCQNHSKNPWLKSFYDYFKMWKFVKG